uniref:ATP-dependent zinc metalloprotease YME1L1 n=1 Tax=Nothobranchius korthausae TaxID=1143690 RepID=A0A1A8ERR1_9TELE
MTAQPQVTLPLSHLINILHPLKHSVGSSSCATCTSRKHKEHASDSELQSTESVWNLRDLGLSDLGKQQLDELVDRVLKGLSPDDVAPAVGGQTAWRASYLSTHSFFHNKHGFSWNSTDPSAVFFSKNCLSPLRTVCTDLNHWPVLFQSRGFKTLRSKTRRVQSAFERPVNSEANAPSFIKGFLTRDKGIDVESLDSLLKNKNIPDGQQEAFKRGFAEGFLKAQALTQRNQDSLRRTRLILLVLLVAGLYGISKTPFMSEALDNALIRPGRFDMQVTVPKPDVKGRTEILNWYLKKIKVDPAIEAKVIARGTVGFSGADLENLVNQAALKAAVDGKDMVSMKELEFAKDKILMGPERRSAEIDKKNKTITAYHESGHAIVAYYTKDAMPINKATIMPRGPSLGHVSMLPENDRWSETRSQLLAQMDVSMGGRVAEEIIFGHENITTGASSDFDSATRIARMMVTRYGMCEKLGVMTFSDRTELSPETQAAVEHEVRVLLKESYDRAKALLKSHTKEHKSLADALLMYETLDAKEIQLVLEGKTLESR